MPELRLARSIDAWREELLAYFDTGGTSNGATVSFTDDGHGNYTAPSRVLARLSFDPANHFYTYTRDGDRLSFVFDRYGTLVSERDRHANTVTYTYTAAGRLSVLAGSGGRQLMLAYGPGGLLDHVSDSAGRTVDYGYDSAGDLTSVRDPGGQVTGYGYDSAHRITTVTGPAGGATTSSYDSLGRVSSQTDAMGRTVGFAYATGPGTNTTTTVTRAGGAVSVHRYTDGMLTSTTDGYGTALAATTSYTYDPTLDVASMIDPLGHLSVYTHDLHGDETSMTDPLGRTSASTYDAESDPTSSTDPAGQVTTNTTALPVT